MAVLLGVAALLIVSNVRSKLNAQTPLFAATLAELRNDIDYVRHAAAGTHAGAIDE
jgi:uncharacterized membrane protein YqjE